MLHYYSQARHIHTYFNTMNLITVLLSLVVACTAIDIVIFKGKLCTGDHAGFYDAQPNVSATLTCLAVLLRGQGIYRWRMGYGSLFCAIRLEH
jgi:hypothetical protein